MENKRLNWIKGCLIGGAAGDALGYPVEFLSESQIFRRYGADGIQEYDLDPVLDRALISDDTQMTLFTANAILIGDTRGKMRGIGGQPCGYVYFTYSDWLKTQNGRPGIPTKGNYSWLNDVPDLNCTRAPGNTCLSAIASSKHGDTEHRINNSKGCGGIMRVAPVGLYKTISKEYVAKEGAEIAAATHGHSLGFMPAAVLAHIIRCIVFPEQALTLKEIVLEARDRVAELFPDDKHLKELLTIIDMAVELSENDSSDLVNIRKLGEGWVAEETLAVAIYCSLRHRDDFSAGIIAAVNHSGDSDSTGAVTGNILGALHGYDAIEEKWKENLELTDVILEMAEDLDQCCLMSEYGSFRDEDWIRKYIHHTWKAEK